MFNKKPMSVAAFENGGDQWGNRFGGNSFVDSLDAKKIGLEPWKPQEGENLIDIIPYNATEENPLFLAGKTNVGDTMYSLDYFVHKGIGPSNKNVTCLTQYGQRCPLCDEAKRYKESSKAEDQKKGQDMAAKRRVVYVIHDLKSGKFGYWDTGWKSVEEKIQKLARITIDPNTKAAVNPFDWEHGKTIKFFGEKKKFNNRDFIEPDLFSFVDREPLSDAVLEHSVDLATVIRKTSAEDMEKLLTGRAPSSAPQTSAPTTSVTYGSAPTPNPAVSTGTPPQASASYTTSTDTVPPTDNSVSNLAEQAMQAAQGTPQPTQSAPSFDTMQPVHNCPHGHKWGEADAHPECGKCDFWEKCYYDSGNK